MIGQAGWAHILSLSGKHDSGPRARRLVPNIPLGLETQFDIVVEAQTAVLYLCVFLQRL